MSSIRLDPLIDEFPEQRASVEKLADFIDKKAEERGPAKEFTVQRIFDTVSPVSQAVLLEILQRLVEQGVLEKILRVESDAMGGIGDFHSLTEIPPVIWDSRSGHEVEVRLDQVRLIYKLQPRDRSA